MSRAALFRRLAATMLVTLVVVIGGIAVYRHLRSSSTIHVLGRDYARSARVETLQQIRADGDQAPIIVNGSHVASHQASGLNLQPTVIYVQHGSVYWQYSLEGGP